MDDLAGHNIPQGPDWRRLAILFSWYLAGIPTAYVMHNSCTMGAPGIWARAIRVFIEGVVAFGLGGFIYVGHLSFRDCAFRANLNTFFFFSGTRTVPFPGPFPYGPAAFSTGKGILKSMRPEVRSCSRISSLNNHLAFLPTVRAHTIICWACAGPV